MFWGPGNNPQHWETRTNQFIGVSYAPCADNYLQHCCFQCQGWNMALCRLGNAVPLSHVPSPLYDGFNDDVSNYLLKAFRFFGTSGFKCLACLVYSPTTCRFTTNFFSQWEDCLNPTFLVSSSQTGLMLHSIPTLSFFWGSNLEFCAVLGKHSS